jgi:hypothetical protein
MRVSTLFLSIIISLIFSIQANGQVYFNQVYPTLRCSGILLGPNGEYITNGWQAVPGTLTFWHRDLILYRLNSQGQKLDSLVVYNNWTDGFGAYAGSLKRLANGDILQLGFISDLGNDDSAFGGIVYRIHSDISDTIWSRKYQFNNLNLTINLDAIEMGNGNIAVAGLYYHSYSPSLYEYIVRGWLYMLDSLGNRLWEKSFNFPTSNAGGSLREIKRAHDGGFLIGALASAGRTHPANPNWNSADGWVIKTDSLGNEQWRHKMTTGSQWYDSEPIIVPTSDGNYVVGQVVTFENFNGYLASNRTKLRFKKLSPLGQVIWSVEYGDTNKVNAPFDHFEPYYISHFIPVEGYELSDQSIVFGGRNESFSGMFKISINGDSIWYRIIQDREENKPNTLYNAAEETARMEDFKPLPSGGFIGAGQYQTGFGSVYPNGAQLNWIVQLDEWGCDSLGCQLIGLPEPPPPKDSYAMRIWPNPASNELYVEIPAQHMGLLITIRNALGQSVYQAFHSNRPIDISHLAAGVYTVESGLPGQLFGYAKLVKR